MNLSEAQDLVARIRKERPDLLARTYKWDERWKVGVKYVEPGSLRVGVPTFVANADEWERLTKRLARGPLWRATR